MERRRFRSEEVRAARASRFAAQLSDALYELGLTHKDLADELGVPRYTVDSWTRGDDSKIPGEVNLSRLCALLEQRKPGAGRALASIAGLAWASDAPATEAAPGRPDPRLTRPVAHPDLTNIPIPLTSFVGREAQIAEIRKLLVSTRLLTLLGPGGIGKTRLSLRVGAEMLPAFPDGVWLVELAPLTDPDLVLQTVARTLGVREQIGRPLAQELPAYLRSRCLLLILDNCEHLIAACAALAGMLLQAASRLTILATSRETLRVPGEVAWQVPALSLPGSGAPKGGKGDERSMDYEAVRLFAERASVSRAGFMLAEENEQAVIDICRRVDGVPLAIELAAACMRVLSPAQITEQLKDRFRILVAGSRLAMPRHQTLRATIDWSYDLLSSPERLMFQRLSVFAGSWNLAAAQAVCVGDGISEDDAFGLLMQLADKSLVVVEDLTQDARYRMLETIREYAVLKLEDDGAYERMAEYFIRHVEANERRYDILELETPNVLASLQIAAARGLWGALIRGANAFYHFLETRGLYGLAEAQLRQALDAGRTMQDDAGLVSALLNLGRLEERRGDYARAEAYYREGLALANKVRDAEQSSAFLQNLGGLYIRRGDYAQAEAYLLEGLALARETGDPERISAILGNLGSAAGSRGDFAQAELYCLESLELARDTGNRERMSALLQNLGVAASNRGNHARAEGYYLESLAIAQEIGHREQTSHLLQKLGELAAGQNDLEQAQAYYHDGLVLARMIDNRERVSGLLESLGVIAGRRGENAQAQEYFQESLELARDIGHKRLVCTILSSWGELYLGQERADLAAGSFAEALAIARELGSQDLIALALYGLARTSASEGNLDRARLYSQESLAILGPMGHTRVAEIERWSVSLNPDG